MVRKVLWYTIKYKMTLTGMATNTSRIECCLTSTVDAQIRRPSGSATHYKCRLQSGCESKQASVSAAQPMTCMLGRTFVLVSAV